jgi:L-ascorbate metabolism protein UlaG (beta-lactamase superfamily)
MTMLRLLGPRRTIPVHFDDYGMFKSPLSDFRNAVLGAGLDAGVVVLGRGDTYILPHLEAESPAPQP